MLLLTTQPLSIHQSAFIICLKLVVFQLYSFTLLSGAQKSFYSIVIALVSEKIKIPL